MIRRIPQEHTQRRIKHYLQEVYGDDSNINNITYYLDGIVKFTTGCIAHGNLVERQSYFPDMVDEIIRRDTSELEAAFGTMKQFGIGQEATNV